MDSQNLRIPKREKEVLFLTAGKNARPIRGYIYLNDISRFGSEHETVEEFLEHCPGFFPVRMKNRNSVRIFNRDSVIYMVDNQAVGEVRTIPVRISCNTGLRLEVDHFNLMPEPRGRLLDYVNRDTRFLVFLRKGKPIFINRRIITSVEER